MPEEGEELKAAGYYATLYDEDWQRNGNKQQWFIVTPNHKSAELGFFDSQQEAWTGLTSTRVRANPTPPATVKPE